MKRIPAIALCLALASCGTPQIATKDVNIAVAQKCDPKVTQPDGHLARSKAELWAMISQAPNVTEQSRIVSDQLLMWLGYGPQLEVAVNACSQNR